MGFNFGRWCGKLLGLQVRCSGSVWGFGMVAWGGGAVLVSLALTFSLPNCCWQRKLKEACTR